MLKGPVASTERFTMPKRATRSRDNGDNLRASNASLHGFEAKVDGSGSTELGLEAWMAACTFVLVICLFLLFCSCMLAV